MRGRAAFVEIGLFLGLVLLAANFWFPAKREPKEPLFPQNQDCQAEAVALRIRFPIRREGHQNFSLVVDPDPRTLLITNCRRFGFQYFMETLEPTGVHVTYQSRDKYYGPNGEGRRDLVVHVSHLQPANSILDPTILTNQNLLTFADRLHRARARFDGQREQIEGSSLDQFRPYSFKRDGEVYFLSRQSAEVELVGHCDDGCYILVFSQRDGLAFTTVFPRAELAKLDDIVQRSLTLIRSWRVE